jgi:hypothetical protein
VDFSGLAKGVQDFWNFIWPPIFCLVALIGLCAYVAPTTLGRLVTLIEDLKPTNDRQIQLVKISKRFGFDKLLPIVCAFFLIFFLDVARNVVILGGQLLPPVISYNPSGILLGNRSNPIVRCLWAAREEQIHKEREAAAKDEPASASMETSALPSGERGDLYFLVSRYGSSDFEDVSQIVENAVADAEAQHRDSEPVSYLYRVEGQVGTAHALFCGLKFFLIYTLVLGFIEIKRGGDRGQTTSRMGIVLCLILIGGFITFLHQLRTYEAEEIQKIAIVARYPLKGSAECVVPPADQEDLEHLYRLMVRSEQDRMNKWWNIKFMDTQIISWSWRQVNGTSLGEFHSR